MIGNKIKIILLGAPGAGKGTLAALLQNNYNLKHISTGNLFRNEIETNGFYASQIKNAMTNGQLIDDKITNKLASNAILSAFDDSDGFILDGYPRTIAQAQFLAKVCDIDFVFYLDIDSNLLNKRITGRRICSKCGTNYNLFFHPPKVEGICDKCGSLLIQRKDDNSETLNTRIIEYFNKTSPLIEFYQEQKKLIKLDASLSIEEIYQDVLNYLNHYGSNKK